MKGSSHRVNVCTDMEEEEKGKGKCKGWVLMFFAARWETAVLWQSV